MADTARVGVLISGRGTNLQALIDATKIPDAPYRIGFVGSNVADAPGLAVARAEGIACWAASHKGMSRAAFDDLMDAQLRSAGCDIIALAGYMRLISDDFIDRWQGRILNIHPSLLPRYKGLDTHRRAIDAGDAQAGCSVHLVTAELDDGPVIAQAAVPVLAEDTPETLAARVLVEEHRLYPRALAEFARTWLIR